jgi:hypothetical protein
MEPPVDRWQEYCLKLHLRIQTLEIRPSGLDLDDRIRNLILRIECIEEPRNAFNPPLKAMLDRIRALEAVHDYCKVHEDSFPLKAFAAAQFEIGRNQKEIRELKERIVALEGVHVSKPLSVKLARDLVKRVDQLEKRDDAVDNRFHNMWSAFEMDQQDTGEDRQRLHNNIVELRKRVDIMEANIASGDRRFTCMKSKLEADQDDAKDEQQLVAEALEALKKRYGFLP